MKEERVDVEPQKEQGGKKRTNRPSSFRLHPYF
jgi:hypothetical protein